MYRIFFKMIFFSVEAFINLMDGGVESGVRNVVEEVSVAVIEDR
jgi:hypothetical protein